MFSGGMPQNGAAAVGHSHFAGMNSSSSSSAIRDFFTVLALSFHAVFEGLAVGLEDTNTGVWTLFTGMNKKKYCM